MFHLRPEIEQQHLPVEVFALKEDGCDFSNQI
jgi:hypothetical protein